MLARIKDLAVMVLHSAVHTVHRHNAKQQQGELVKAFAAMIRGITTNRLLFKSCTCGNCMSFIRGVTYRTNLEFSYISMFQKLL